MPIEVIRGRKPGPTVFVSAAVHGDEINGVEIIHRLLRMRVLNRIRGTLICIPIVNVFGFLNKSRYLPDGRDLNRSFPGSVSGSLTSRLANIFLTEIAGRCQYGIDLHTAAADRFNLPQIRANLDDEETLRLARAFHVPALINSNLRDGSLRQAVAELGVRVLVYEGGERLRFNEPVIRAGLHGIVALLRELGMLQKRRRATAFPEPLIARGTSWMRAPCSGIHRILIEPGDRVKPGDPMGVLSDPFGRSEEIVTAEHNGIVIGLTSLPLINEGDALYHVARFSSSAEAAEKVEAFREAVDSADPLIPDTEPPTY
ncbi:MAG: succinylglutamate desuccinylase/aspartoacylase family protein [Gammaproteobacteria bacterium]|nr:succinylglutamate desuccinylase/aspartoacylase family protein [Gammaproteobacteria bacterium]NNM00886.1 succinylglutamate desuccinylase/aspartoacylase family protein [Gammaproteobacteria bacterium]